MMPVWEVDSNGNIINNYVWEQEEIDAAIGEGRHIITSPWVNLYVPKYDLVNKKWIEGLTNDQIFAIKKAGKLAELESACYNATFSRFSATVNGTTYWFEHDDMAQRFFEMADKDLANGKLTSVKWTVYDAQTGGNLIRVTLDSTSFPTVYTAHGDAILNNNSKLRDTLEPQVKAIQIQNGDLQTALNQLNSIVWN